MSKSVISKVYNTVITNNMISSGDRVLVGLSGGADSVFLTEVLVRISRDFRFEIACAHLNHGIRGDEAYRDQEFCRRLCIEKNIRFHSREINIPKLASENKISEETCGREERYRFFKQLCSEFGYNKIAVAHNMNDSIETIILNMIRGASLNGLSGIDYTNGYVIRPIIEISRSEIEEYLKEHNITYCTDSTNLTTEYTRNKIRHLIVSEMKNINPSVVNTVFNNAKNIRDDNDFINKFVDSLECITEQNNVVCIDRKVLDTQHIAIKKRIIMKAFTLINGGNNNIGINHVDILLARLQSGKKYDMPNNITAYVSFDKITMSKQSIPDVSYRCDFIPEAHIDFNGRISVKSCFSDKIDLNDKSCLYLDYDMLENHRLILRSRINGDKFIPYGMQHSKKLKQLLIELKIPSEARNDVPILCADEEIAAVIPYRISDKYKVSKNTKKILKITQEKKKNG